MKFPLFHTLACASVALMAANFSLVAQNTNSASQGDGFTVQARPGIALVKPQAWSKPNEATVMEFEAFTDRTVKGTPGAGYYEFKTKAVDKRQVPASKVVKVLVYPDAQLFPQIISGQERQQVADVIAEMKSAISNYPAAQTYLNPSLKKLDTELAQYDSGKVKVNGAWQSREAYVATQISSLGTQLKGDILRAKPSSSFDLPNDPRFIALQEMGGSSASADALAKELTTLRDKLVRNESRADLLARLADTSISLSEAEGAVARLKALQPEEDPKSVAFLKKWDASSQLAKSMDDTAAPLLTAYETELAAVQATNALPAVSPALQAKVTALSEQARQFTASNPAPVLLIETKKSLALAQVSDNFTKLGPLFQEKKFLDAKDILDAMANKAETVGPQTQRVVNGLQTFAGDQIMKFTRQREEAQLLASSGKNVEALKKYEEAFATIPDGDVGEQIDKLKPVVEKKN